SASDYERLYERERVASDVIRLLFESRSVFFVGFSCDDEAVMDRVRRSAALVGAQHYALFGVNADDDVRSLCYEYEKVKRVCLFTYDKSDDHRDLVPWLQTLAYDVTEERWRRLPDQFRTMVGK